MHGADLTTFSRRLECLLLETSLVTRLLVFLLISSILWRLADRFSGTLEVVVWDVGQGDAAFIRFPGGKTLLIDAGGGHRDWNVGSRVIVSELARRGALTIDYAVLSHPDQDHGYGFLGVDRELRVGEFWLNGFEPWERPKPLLRKLVRAAAVEDTPIRLISHFDRVEINGVSVRRLPLGKATTAHSTNDRTLALLIEWKGCSFAFTGDMEKKGEKEFFRRVTDRVTVLKVAHHGSKSSSWGSNLVKARPVWAVFSSGAGNSYGHPHPSVVERFRNLATRSLRTDFHGYVRFEVTPSGTIQCTNGRGGCGRLDCLGGGSLDPHLPFFQRQ